MKTSKQEVIINHSAKSIYEIVLDIEKYPEFIPWCSDVQIHSKTKKNIIADLLVKYKFFKINFTSDVRFDSNKLVINVIYIKGPLKNLQNQWKFVKIEDNKTNVLFTIKFEFKNFIYQKMTEVFFDLIENKMIHSFKKRADDILN